MKKNKTFLKWAGNKSHCLEHILPELPNGKRLIEPFGGSAAVFLNTHYKKYLIAENNTDVILLFSQLKTQGRAFIETCLSYFQPQNNCETLYYQFRERFNQCEDPIERAALFLYLNRHGYNGLCRYNRRGNYNVPFGRYEKPYFPQQELTFFYKKSKTAQFVEADFRESFAQARAGDVIYCDPPYVPLSKTANFSSYTFKKFSEHDQIALAELAHEYAAKGIPVLISNHDTEFTRQLYAKARIKTFLATRKISCHSTRRHPAKELLAIF